MNIEAFPGLSLPFFALLVLMIVLVGLEVGLYRKRQSKWAVALWLPLILTTLLGCSGIALRFLDVSSLRQSSGDLAGLGFIFDFCLLSPWVVILVGAMFCIPKFSKQGLHAWIVGTFVFATILGGLLIRGEISEATRFVVLNSKGDPIPNQMLSMLSSRYGNPHIGGFVVTDHDGTFTLWLSPGESVFLDAPEGSFLGSVRIWNQEDITLLQKTTLNTYSDWDYSEMHQYGHKWGTFPVSIVIGQKKPVALILKSNTELASPYVRTMVRAVLLQARDGTCSLDLAQLVSNPEALEQLDLISEVMAKQPSTRPALIQGLQWSGQFVISLNNAANPHMDPPGLGAERCLYVQWFNLTPNTAPRPSDALTPAFKQKVDALTLQIISTVKPYLGTEPGASGVIREMGVAGRPAIQDFAQAFPSATKQCQDQMLNSLWALRPQVSDLGWLVESNDPHLVFAGYEAARDTIKPEERDLAKERVDEALAKATAPGDTSRGKILSADMGRVNAGPIINRGIAFLQQGDETNALIAFNRAIDLDQYSANAYLNRGVVYDHQGDEVKALADFNQAIQLDPYNALAYNNRGIAYGKSGNQAKAVLDFSKCIEFDSSDANAYFNRSISYERLGDNVHALADLNRAVVADRRNAKAYNAIAWLLATCPQANLRDGKKAVENATKACELSGWKDLNFVDTLAAAYAESGDFDNAVKWENKYLETPNLNASDAASGKSRLALYQMHQPYRDVK